jgi:hypothetical protein
MKDSSNFATPSERFRYNACIFHVALQKQPAALAHKEQQGARSAFLAAILAASLAARTAD